MYEDSLAQKLPQTNSATILETIGDAFASQLERLEKGVAVLSGIVNKLREDGPKELPEKTLTAERVPGKLSGLESLTERFADLNRKLESQLGKLDRLI